MDDTTLYCLLANELEIAGMQAQRPHHTHSSPRTPTSASVHKRQHTTGSWGAPSPSPGSSPSRSGFLAAAAHQEANNNTAGGGDRSGSPDRVHHLAQLLAANPQMRTTALRLLQQQQQHDSWQAAPVQLYSPSGSFSRANPGVRQVPHHGACTTGGTPQDDDCSLAQLAAALNQRVEQQAVGWECGPRPVPVAPAAAWQQCERDDTTPGLLQLGDSGAAADGDALVGDLEQMLLESLGGASCLTPQQHNETRSDASSHGRAREHQRAPSTNWTSAPLPSLSLASGGIIGHQQPAGPAYPVLFHMGSLPELQHHAATHGGGNTSQNNSDGSFCSTTTTRDDGCAPDAGAATMAAPALGRSASTHHRVTARRRSSQTGGAAEQHGGGGTCRGACLSLPLPRLNCLPDAAAGWDEPAAAGLLLAPKRANSIDADELFMQLVRSMAPQPQLAAALAGGAWRGY